GTRHPLEILRHFVGAGEHAQLVEPLLEPQIELAGCLGGEAVLLARDLLGERALTVYVGDPHRGERRNERGQYREREQLVPDALEPQRVQASRDPPLPGAHATPGTPARRPTARRSPAPAHRSCANRPSAAPGGAPGGSLRCGRRPASSCSTRHGRRTCTSTAWRTRHRSWPRGPCERPARCGRAAPGSPCRFPK